PGTETSPFSSVTDAQCLVDPCLTQPCREWDPGDRSSSAPISSSYKRLALASDTARTPPDPLPGRSRSRATHESLGPRLPCGARDCGSRQHGLPGWELD